jgi:hypothetical protein
MHPREFWWIAEAKQDALDHMPGQYAGMSRAQAAAIYKEAYPDG